MPFSDDMLEWIKGLSKHAASGGPPGGHVDIGADPAMQQAAQGASVPAQPPAAPTPQRTVSYDDARTEANAGAKQVRAQQGMTDPRVQAGHTQAARHTPESGAPDAQVNDPDSFMHLYSRLNKGRPGDQELDVNTVDPDGTANTRTRHTAQEEIIDDAVARSRNGGKLTPEGQQAAGDEVLWRTKGTGFDQREVAEKRASGVFDEKAAIENSDAVKQYRAAKAAKAAAPAETAPAETAPMEAPAPSAKPATAQAPESLPPASGQGGAPTEYPPNTPSRAPTQPPPGPAPDVPATEPNPYPGNDPLNPRIPRPPRVPVIEEPGPPSTPARAPVAEPVVEPVPGPVAEPVAKVQGTATSGEAATIKSGAIGGVVAGMQTLVGDLGKVRSGQMTMGQAATDAGEKGGETGVLTYIGNKVANATAGGAGGEAGATAGLAGGESGAAAGLAGGESGAVAGLAGGEAGAVAAGAANVVSKGGVIGGVVAGGMALIDDVGKVRSGQMTAGTATVDVGAKTAVGVGAGMAGAAVGTAVGAAATAALAGSELGAALGTVVPGVGNAIGFVAGGLVGAGVGLVGNELMKTETGKAVLEAGGKAVDATIHGVEAAAGAVKDGAEAVVHGVENVAHKVEDAASGAVNAVEDAAGGVLKKIGSLF